MGSPARYYSSTAVRTTLVSSIGTSDTSFQPASDSGFPPSYPFVLVFEKDSANEEIVEVTAKVGSSFTITRGIDGTSARSHSAGTSVEHALIADDLTDFRAHEAAASGVHDVGAGASVVGTTTTQTLSNKTLGSNLAAGGFRITGLADPSSAQDVVTKNWAETGMTSQLTAATTQATNAAASASAASASESAAASSETAAAASEGAAGTSATAAAASASTASTQASNAASSASSSASSASAAAASASAASTSQTAAAGSATAAAGSASAAATDAASAAASAAAAASTYDTFDDRYLGSKSSAPTVDNDGNALLTGALYYLNTGTAEQVGMYAWDGSAWVKAGSSGIADGSVTNAKLQNSSITINGSAVSLGGSVNVTGESFHPFLLIGA